MAAFALASSITPGPVNPKAWLASLAGMGAYAAGGDGRLVWQFTTLYFVICYLSIASWAYVSTFLRGHLRGARVQFSAMNSAARASWPLASRSGKLVGSSVCCTLEKKVMAALYLRSVPVSSSLARIAHSRFRPSNNAASLANDAACPAQCGYFGLTSILPRYFAASVFTVPSACTFAMAAFS